MAILSALFNQNVSDYQEAFQVKDITSAEMKQAIRDCFDLYFGQENEFEDDCQRLPVIIVNKITKTTFAEYEVKYKAESNNEFLNSVDEELDAVKKQAMQFMLLGGECLIKPVIEDDKISFMPIRRDCFIPLGRDNKGNIISVGTAEFTVFDGYYYTLLERRTVENGQLKIENKLFWSKTAQSLGSNIPLGTLEKYADLDNRSFVYNGKVYKLGETTLQDLIDGGLPFDEKEIKNAENNVNGNHETSRYTINLNDLTFIQLVFINKTDDSMPEKDCLLSTVRWNVLYVPHDDYQDSLIEQIVSSINDCAKDLSFSFPYYLTKDELLEKCPDPTSTDEYGKVSYMVASEVYMGSSGYSFQFDKDTNQLKDVTISWLP